MKWFKEKKYTSKLSYEGALIHEGVHWQQQQQDGFALFYGRTIVNYIKSCFKYGSVTFLYDGTCVPGNYEQRATNKELKYLWK